MALSRPVPGENGRKLTRRECEVLESLAQRGRSNKQIAAELGLSPHTVDTFLEKISLKIREKDPPNRTEMAVWWVEHRALYAERPADGLDTCETPGEAAYGAFLASGEAHRVRSFPPWEDLACDRRDRWEDISEAGRATRVRRGDNDAVTAYLSGR